MNRFFRNASWGLAAAMVVTTTLAGTATATPTGPAAGTDRASKQVSLKADPQAWKSRIDRLEGEEHLGNDKVDLAEVLDKADRSTPDGTQCGTDDHPKSGFCWNKGDNLNPQWTPQGITASWDAYPDGKYHPGKGHKGARTVVAASWYFKENPKADESAVRVAFSDRDRKKYDFVALAVPVKSKDSKHVGINPLKNVHAGGLAWVGHYLYVPDTKRGIRVFDLRHLWKADTSSHEYKVAGGKVSAGGYRYVLPQIGYYTYPKGTDVEKCDPKHKPVFSSLAVDRKSGSLVSGEFCYSDDRDGRIVLWPLKKDDKGYSGALAAKHGRLVSSKWFTSPLGRMQGVVTHGDDVWMSVSKGQEHHQKGRWYTGSIAGVRGDGGRVHLRSKHVMCTQGPEDMTYHNGHSVWTLTEYADERQLFPVQKSKDCTPAG